MKISPTLNKEKIVDGNMLHPQSSALLGRRLWVPGEEIVGKVDSHPPSSTPLEEEIVGGSLTPPQPLTLLEEKIVGKVRHPQS